MVPKMIELLPLENVDQKIEMSIEIGHKAAVRSLPTKEGHTHDWIVYVRTDQNQFVEKVEFNLHPSFKKPKRVVASAPFQLLENGYGEFNMKIVVHFKVNNHREKVPYEYYLFLSSEPTISYSVHKQHTIDLTNPARTKKPGRPKKNNSLKETNTSSESLSNSSVTKNSLIVPPRKPGRPRKNGTIPVKTMKSPDVDLPSPFSSSSTSSLQSSPSLTSSDDDILPMPPSTAKLSYTPSSSSSPTSKMFQHDTRQLKTKHTVSTLPAGKLQEFADWSLAQTATTLHSANQYYINERINDLVELQKTLMSLKDKKVLKRIVKIIKVAGYLQMTDSTFDFDLMEMDDVTINCIKETLTNQ
ncbi:hypothetical protein HELRODRAFT_178766 [Helobdella robusta]|uniref:YEATS domain-containing protein n=1 Tax=Helobdella robusta TaxID=6412 RepID=T1FDP5_HELRO|nr:hypothetical protein HELRODRAFT_178766 [Helobdella robusta]ESN96962.1 hypothetical protein HELRODRAFT_178766 [Helobdella robusta]